jgi:hypothetical protein
MLDLNISTPNPILDLDATIFTFMLNLDEYAPTPNTLKHEFLFTFYTIFYKNKNKSITGIQLVLLKNR